jgi:Protein of unknown function (DUF4238)
MGKHYVPQKYLQGFAVPNDSTRIWMYDKKTRSWSLPSIKRVAQQRDYFPEDVETRLTFEIENPANAVLNRLRQGQQLDNQDRAALENYIAVMLMRVPRRRRKGYESFPAVRESTFAEIREEIASSTNEVGQDLISSLLKEIDRLEEVYEDVIPENVRERIHSPWASDAIIGAIRQMTWRLTPAARGTFFLTSDNPAYFFEAFGVGSERAELTFPISSTLAMLGSHRGAPGSTIMTRVRTAISKEINRRMISGAERFIFTPQRATWIEVIASKPDPYLSRIEWH